jgi:phage terminase small subunit
MAGLNLRQERFCLAVFQDPNASPTRAYKQAGYKVTNDRAAAACASRLLQNANTAGRLDELRAEQAKAALLTRDEILNQVLETYKLATERGQSVAALRALEMLGTELHGMFKRHTQVDVKARMREMSTEELMAALDRNLAMLGLRSPIDDQSSNADTAPLQVRDSDTC